MDLIDGFKLTASPVYAETCPLHDLVFERRLPYRPFAPVFLLDVRSLDRRRFVLLAP
jgi:hypothetical protein